MASEMRPLRTIMREVVALAAQKASGVLLIVTEDNRFASIRFRSGKIEEVSFKNRFNDEGVHLLSQVHTLRARFQPGLAPPTTHAPLSEAALQWLLGGFENQAFASSTQATGGSSTNSTAAADPHARQRKTIENVALGYLGPIAGLLCDEAFSSGKGIDHILRQIASNLSEAGEGERFIAEALAALKKAT